MRFVLIKTVEQQAVLTVHRAKGLEYDLVVLVDLDKVFKVNDAIVWRRDGSDLVGPDAVYRQLVDWLDDLGLREPPASVEAGSPAPAPSPSPEPAPDAVPASS